MLNLISMKTKAEKIVQKMYENDAFSQWMGIQIISVQENEVIIEMVIREDMLNGFKIAHGGITFSFADSALAFASNTVGYHAVSINNSISYFKKVKVGDVLTAKATIMNRSRKIGVYEVKLINQKADNVASFKGTVYISGTEWEID